MSLYCTRTTRNKRNYFAKGQKVHMIYTSPADLRIILIDFFRGLSIIIYEGHFLPYGEVVVVVVVVVVEAR